MYLRERGYQLELVPALLGASVRYQQKTLFSFVKLSSSISCMTMESTLANPLPPCQPARHPRRAIAVLQNEAVSK
jgi:hypothetical protein